MIKRILVVHNAYQQQGGEDAVVNAEIKLLQENGHEIETMLEHNDSLNEMSKFKALTRTFWSKESTSELNTLMRGFRPDVIHVHNTFPLISPAVYWAADKLRVPVVQTLHNFRIHCPKATYLRNGVICEDCIGRVPWRAAVRSCYRDSSVQSATLASMLTLHSALGTWRNKITRYIALNEFCRKKFIEGGLPAERILTKPNFCDQPAIRVAKREGFLYVGRLSTEKGISTLAGAIESLRFRIKIAGAGPSADLIPDAPSVTKLGKLPSDAIWRYLTEAQALILPSICYEGFPMVIVEAFAAGLPVIASRLGSMAELVEDGVTGLLFEPGNVNDLSAKIQWAEAHPDQMEKMGAAARAKYEMYYTPTKNYQQLIDIYQDAINDRSISQARS